MEILGDNSSGYFSDVNASEVGVRNIEKKSVYLRWSKMHRWFEMELTNGDDGGYRQYLWMTIT